MYPDFFFFFAKSYLSKFLLDRHAAPPTTLRTFLSEKSRSTKSPSDKTILFGVKLNRLEQLISIGRGGVVAIERGRR